MSILNSSILTPAETNAQQIVKNISFLKINILRTLSTNVALLNQDTLNVFGTEAGSLFAEVQALVAYATERLNANGDTEGLAKLNAIVAKIPTVTINQDGTATINS